MNDVIRSAQRLDCLWTKQAMGIGDDADQDRQFSVLSTQFSVLHLLNKACDAYDGAAHGTTADFLDLVARSHAKGVETTVE